MKATLTTILFAALLLGCARSSLNEGATIDADKFQQMMNDNKDAVILDVRTPEEFAGGHIPGAVLINVYDHDFKDKVNELDNSKTILVYCAAGIRSEKASEILKENGFKEVYNLKGGIKAWSQAQKELTK